MLLFSTVLDINDSLTKDDFIQLVIDWNQSSTYKQNIIHGIDWHGERNIRYGDERMWLDIQEYRNGNIIAVRYEKTEDDGVIWDTDYVMNFDEMKMSIRLDRSFLADALKVDRKFSTPHFIELLSDGGYLKDDGDLPTTRFPIIIDETNLDALRGVINDAQRYKLPVVYVSKIFNNFNPIDVDLLAKRLKGVAHVLVQKDNCLGNKIREVCDSRNEYNGAVGVYFPNPAFPHQRFFYRAYQGFDEFLFAKVMRFVINYSVLQAVSTLYTWQGVSNALLRDRLISRGADLIALEKAKNSAVNAQELAERKREEAEQQRAAALKEKDEANQLVESTDDEIERMKHEIEQMKQQIKDITHENERLAAENNGLLSKMSGLDSLPMLFSGSEDDFFPGEVKDIVLCTLEEAVKDKPQSRRTDVLKDVIRSNNHEHLLDGRARELKTKLRGYQTMSGQLRRYLEGLGFVITEEGKHYRLTYFGDARYHTTISKTCSDRRAGDNSALQIIRDML
jgi:hypothetical protein